MFQREMNRKCITQRLITISGKGAAHTHHTISRVVSRIASFLMVPSFGNFSYRKVESECR